MLDTILVSISIALALSVDAFIACLAYATNQVRVKNSTIYTPILIGVLHFIFPFLTFTFCKLFTYKLEEVGNILGGIIFLFLGLLSIFKKEEETCRILDVLGIILLAVGVSIDSLLVGISLSFSLESIILPAIIFGIISSSISFLSIKLGRKLCLIKVNFDLIAGLFFIFLGVATFFNWF